jgi:sec-independent protein translocase protein TatA
MPSPLLALLPDVGGPELLLIFLVVLLLFGGKRLPELARGIGKSIREFKRATAGVEQELKRVLEDEPAERRARAEKKRLEPGETAAAAAIAATTATAPAETSAAASAETPDTAPATAAAGETQAEENTDEPKADDYYDTTDDDFSTGEDLDYAHHSYDDSTNPYPELRDDGTGTGPAQDAGTTPPEIEAPESGTPESEAPESGADGQPEENPSAPPSPESGDGGGI